MSKIFRVIALQKKTYSDPGQNRDAVKAMLDSYSGPQISSPDGSAGRHRWP